MKNQIIYLLALSVGILAVIFRLPLVAEEPQSKEKLPWSQAPSDIIDPDFKDQIDLLEIRQAVQSLDSSLLLEQTRKLAQAEKKVGRPHKTIPSQALFDLTLRTIADEHDQKKLLDKVEGMLAELGQADAKPLLAEIRKLVAAPRRVDLGPGVQLDEVSSEAIILYGAFKERVRVAKLVGDTVALAQLRRTIAAKSELHPKQRAYLTKFADESIAALAPRPDASTVALSRLTGFSRGAEEKGN